MTLSKGDFQENISKKKKNKMELKSYDLNSCFIICQISLESFNFINFFND